MERSIVSSLERALLAKFLILGKMGVSWPLLVRFSSFYCSLRVRKRHTSIRLDSVFIYMELLTHLTSGFSLFGSQGLCICERSCVARLPEIRYHDLWARIILLFTAVSTIINAVIQYSTCTVKRIKIGYEAWFDFL